MVEGSKNLASTEALWLERTPPLEKFPSRPENLGRVYVNAPTETVVIDGQVLADGQDGDWADVDRLNPGGGRVALWYNYSELPTTNVTAPTGSSPIPGSAGTVFLRPHATDTAVLGDLIVDNGGVSSGLYSPTRTGLSELRDVVKRNSGRLEANQVIEITRDISVTTGGRFGRP